MKKQKKKFLIFTVFFAILTVGFFFRLKGIENNHSFWADEADISSYARELIKGQVNLPQMVNYSYQPLENLLVAASFQIFGISEQSARLPAVIFSTLGIIFAYLLASKLSDYSGGLLAAFLFAFSQLNLAHATQTKPYAIIETSILAVMYLILVISEIKNYRVRIKYNLLIFMTLTLASFLHPVALFTWIIYIVYFIVQFRSNILKKPLIIFMILVFIITTIACLFIATLLKIFLLPQDITSFFATNNLTYLRELLWKNYAFITLPAIMGIIATFGKYKSQTLGLVVWMLMLIFFWNFRAFHNIRYLMPVFGILLVYFGVFWATVGQKLFNGQSALVCSMVAILLYTGGYKIIRTPQSYYTPNADLFADIQIADYKTAFSQLKIKFPDYKNLATFNSFLEPQRWYLETHPTVYFMKSINNLEITHGVDKHPIYGNLKKFLKAKEKYKKGLLIVEDWQSILPDDIKEYAKKNLKREIRVEGLPQAKGDNWPIEVYSWGM